MQQNPWQSNYSAFLLMRGRSSITSKRALKLFLIALSIAIASVVGIFMVMDTGDQRTDHYRGPYLLACVVIPLILPVLFYVGQFIVKYVRKPLNGGSDELRNQAISNPNDSPIPPGFPVIEIIPEYSPPTDGPGKYRIEGVDRKTEMDTTLHVHADSAINAKVKAELQGIVVTAVVKE